MRDWDRLASALQGTVAAGFDAVELEVSAAELATSLLGARAAELRALAQQQGTAVSSLVLSWHMDPRCEHYAGLTVPERRDGALRAVERGVALARSLGARVVLIPFFGDSDLRRGAAVVEVARHSLRQLAGSMNDPDVVIGIETTLRSPELVTLLDGVASAAVGAYVDAGNVMCLGEDPIEHLRHVGRHLFAIQFKEFVPDSEWRPAAANPSVRERMREFRWLNRAPLGGGALPVREILSHLRAIGFAGPTTIELFPCPLPDPAGALHAGLRHLRATSEALESERAPG